MTNRRADGGDCNIPIAGIITLCLITSGPGRVTANKVISLPALKSFYLSKYIRFPIPPKHAKFFMLKRSKVHGDKLTSFWHGNDVT